MHLFENAKGIVHSLTHVTQTNTGTIAALRELTIPEKKIQEEKESEEKGEEKEKSEEEEKESSPSTSPSSDMFATGDGDMTSTTMTMMNTTKSSWRDLKRPRSARANLFRANLSTGNTCNDILTQIKHRRPVTAIPTRRSPKRFVIRSPPFSKTRSNLGFDRPWISSSMMGRSDTTSSSHFRDWTRTWCQCRSITMKLTRI